MYSIYIYSTLPISTLGSGPGDELQHSPPLPGAQDRDQTHLEVSTISTKYNNNIITISTAGRVWTWALAALRTYPTPSGDSKKDSFFQERAQANFTYFYMR